MAGWDKFKLLGMSGFIVLCSEEVRASARTFILGLTAASASEASGVKTSDQSALCVGAEAPTSLRLAPRESVGHPQLLFGGVGRTECSSITINMVE
jgi:hypothetical protein